MVKYYLTYCLVCRYIIQKPGVFSRSLKFNLLFSAKQFGQRAKLGMPGGNFALWGPGLFCRVKSAIPLPTNYSKEPYNIYNTRAWRNWQTRKV